MFVIQSPPAVPQVELLKMLQSWLIRSECDRVYSRDRLEEVGTTRYSQKEFSVRLQPQLAIQTNPFKLDLRLLCLLLDYQISS